MEQEQTISDISLDDFTYGDKVLTEWADELTVSMPRLPAQSQEVANCLTSMNNKYQLAYNCFNELKVVCSAKQSVLTSTKNEIMSKKAAEYKAEGVRVPGRDILESLALATSDCKALFEDVQMYELIMGFFEDHKTKLEKCMNLCVAVLYSVKGSDKMHDTGAR